jgi:uncharacterized membrane protein
MAAHAPPFEATIYPNPPMGRRGFAVLMACVVAVNFVMALGFLAMGAWPVSGFLGLDVVLLYLAFHVVRRRSQCREHIRLDESGLHVRLVAANGSAREWCFEPYWVQVRMDDPPLRNSWLTLASHGLSLRVGSFLTPAERLDLARALRNALRPYR